MKASIAGRKKTDLLSDANVIVAVAGIFDINNDTFRLRQLGVRPLACPPVGEPADQRVDREVVAPHEDLADHQRLAGLGEGLLEGDRGEPAPPAGQPGLDRRLLLLENAAAPATPDASIDASSAIAQSCAGVP